MICYNSKVLKFVLFIAKSRNQIIRGNLKKKNGNIENPTVFFLYHTIYFFFLEYIIISFFYMYNVGLHDLFRIVHHRTESDHFHFIYNFQFKQLQRITKNSGFSHI